MHIFFTSSCQHGKRLLTAVQQVAPHEELFICHSMAELFSLNTKPAYHSDIIILIASNHRDFSTLSTFRDHLLDMRLILILPDKKPETLSQGYAFFPRFLTDINSDFKDIQKVLTKMQHPTFQQK